MLASIDVACCLWLVKSWSTFILHSVLLTNGVRDGGLLRPPEAVIHYIVLAD